MKIRHLESDTLVRFFGLTFGEKKLIPPAAPQWHQFVVSTRDPLMIESQTATWLVEKGTGIWLPAGAGCTFLNRAETSVRMLYFPVSADLDPRFNDGISKVLAVSPLLVQLIERVVTLGALTRKDPHQIRLAALIADELNDAPELPTALPHPTSAFLTKFVAAMEQAHFRLDAFDPLVLGTGFSRRTIERAFVAETRLSPGAWFKKRRLILALELLTAGQTVEEVSFHLGYKSASAFIAMFKSELGRPPGEFVRQWERCL